MNVQYFTFQISLLYWEKKKFKYRRYHVLTQDQGTQECPQSLWRDEWLHYWEIFWTDQSQKA